METLEREMTFIDALDEAFKKYATKTALLYLGRSISYAELRELVNRFATGLAGHGINIKENDKVIIYLPNTPQWVIAFLALLKMGAVAVPISPIYTPAEVIYMSKDCGAETIICQDTNFGYVKEVMPKSPLKTGIYTNIADMLPWWKRGVGFLFDKIPHGKVERGEGVWNFKNLLKYPSKPPEVPIKNPREHLAYILYTGGTTGLPKGVPHSHTILYYGIYDIIEVIEGTYVEKGNSRVIAQLPFYHALGLTAFFAYGLFKGNTSILIPLPQVDTILECIQRYKSDFFIGVPTLYRMILENDRLNQYDLSSLRYCLSGGDVLPVEVSSRWKEKTSIPVHQLYGSTEVLLMAATPLNKSPKLKSIGVPKTSTYKKYKLVDPETLEEVPQGMPGELVVSAPYMMTAYLNKPEETVESFVEIDNEIYYRTKDILEAKNGELYFVDRSADVIKHKGYRVSASEIEAVLQDHSAVIGACVVGVPDSKVGERIKAFVVLKEDVRGIGSHDLIKWCRERLTPYKVPQYIEFRDMLPKSKVGKLLRREMRAEERRKVGKKKE